MGMETETLQQREMPDIAPSNLSIKPKEMKREKWAHKIDFLMAAVGYSVGLGNVWRFPYLCYKNGGGAFLVPYIISSVVVGIPMVFLEASMSQFMSSGTISVWDICPLFKGIGYGLTVLPFIIHIYYIVIIAWAVYYLFHSFTTALPWSSCNNTWNSDNCQLFGSANLNESGASLRVQLENSSEGGNCSDLSDPATEFWERKVLQISSGIEDVGSIRWDLALCLLLTWIVVYFCIWKGIKITGKVMYFTATFPYVLLLVLLIRGVTLPGSVEGLKHYLIPDVKKLGSGEVWVDACTQVLYSYGVSQGMIYTLASFNQWNHNCWRDCTLIAFINGMTSFLSGFVIYSVLGFMTKEHGVPISEVAESGPGLAFIIYPMAVSMIPLAPIWSVLFFCMLILLGLDSQFVAMESVVTSVSDVFPVLRLGRYRKLFVGAVCVASAILALPIITNGGIYVFQLLDYYAGNKLILLIAITECVVITQIYGVNRFYDNLEMMLGFRPGPYCKICWIALTPIFLLVIFCLCLVSYSEVVYNRTYIYPQWAVVLGWMIASCSVLFTPIGIIIQMYRTEGTMKQRLKKLARPRLQAHQMRSCDDPRDLKHAENDPVFVTSQEGFLKTFTEEMERL